MKTITWHIRLPGFLRSQKNVVLFLGLWLGIGVFQQMILSEEQGSIVYIWSPWDESMDTKTYRHPPNPPVNYPLKKDDAEYPEWNPTNLQRLLNSPSSVCKHLTSLGGVYSCNDCKTCKIDGNKYVCFDTDVRPVPGNCLVYSVGVGGDITWDRKMLSYNCSIYAFDMTTKHDNLMLSEGFHFLNIGLYEGNYDSLLNMSSHDPGIPVVSKKAFLRKLSTIRDILGHKQRPIDILKMDIEFTEWSVFESIFSSPEEAKVLDDVKQIALEIHLDDFKNSSAAERVAGGRRVEKVLQDLKDHGFHMVHTELNTAFQVHAEVRGQVVPLFRESLFVNRP